MPLTPATRHGKRWTWSDYQTWTEEERWEIIDGQALAMSPAPSTSHQGVALRIAARLDRALAGQTCRPFIAPVDVKLSDTDVVQPDILVVCDTRKITPSCIDGAPDVVIEVLSPATAIRDLREKKALYAKYGVREYVIVDPLEQYAMRFELGSGGYDVGTTIGGDELLTLVSLTEIAIPLWEVFELPEPGSIPPASGPA